LEDKTVEKEQKPKKRESVPRGGTDPNVCMKTESCIYGGRSGSLLLCDYLEITGHRRPCPVKGCTEYKKKKRKRNKTMVSLDDMGCEGEKVWIN